LDGHAPDRYLSKSRRGIVFASPQKSNYHEFIKQNGSVLYMPPWLWDEVAAFVGDSAMEVNIQSLFASWQKRHNQLLKLPMEDIGMR
jgi:hypothetical protein